MARYRLQRRQLVVQRCEFLGRQHAAKVNPPSLLGDERQVAAGIDDETRHLLADQRREAALDVDEGGEQCRVERLRAALWISTRGPLDAYKRAGRCGGAAARLLARDEERARPPPH